MVPLLTFVLNASFNPSITISVILLILMIKSFRISLTVFKLLTNFPIKTWKNIETLTIGLLLIVFKALNKSYSLHYTYAKAHFCLLGLQMRTSLERMSGKNIYSQRIINDFFQCIEQIFCWHCFRKFSLIAAPLVIVWTTHEVDQQTKEGSLIGIPVVDGFINAIASTMSYKGWVFGWI